MLFGKKPRSVAYGPAQRHQMDLYLPQPKNDEAAALSPVLIYIHGGSWKTGSRTIYRFLGQAYAARGYCTLIPDYRLHPEGLFPGFVEDAARVVAWAKDHVEQYGGDPTRIVLMGQSAGAHIASLVTLSPRWLNSFGASPNDLRGFFGLAGPYSFYPPDYASIRDVFEHLECLEDGAKKDERHVGLHMDSARPIKQAHGHAPPIVLGHGTADKTVGIHESENLVAAIQEAGGTIKLHRYPRIGHIAIVLAIAWPLRFIAPVFRDSLNAFEGFLNTNAVRPSEK